jgi:hypothetical protein
VDAARRTDTGALNASYAWRIENPHSPIAGNSDFLKRQLTEPGWISYSDLRDLNDLLCNNLSDGIGPVDHLQGSQGTLVGRDERSDIFGPVAVAARATRTDTA